MKKFFYNYPLRKLYLSTINTFFLWQSPSLKHKTMTLTNTKLCLSLLSTIVLWRTSSNIRSNSLWIQKKLYKSVSGLVHVWDNACILFLFVWFLLFLATYFFPWRRTILKTCPPPSRSPRLLSPLPLAWNELNLFSVHSLTRFQPLAQPLLFRYTVRWGV